MAKTNDMLGFGKSTKATLGNGKNYLLAVGIDDYVSHPKLYNAVKDAKEVVSLLKERYRFEADYIFELYNKESTKRKIFNVIKELAQVITPQDNFLFYFSGHGEYDTITEEGYWIPVEAENGEEADYIPNSVMKIKLGGIKSLHTFLMVDSCFSGSIFARGAKRRVEKRYESDPSRWGLTSGRNEIVSDGTPGYNSPFAESLLYRLRNNTGPISVLELCAHVVEYVKTNSNQSPIGEPLQIKGHKNGQFVFYLKKPVKEKLKNEFQNKQPKPPEIIQEDQVTVTPQVAPINISELRNWIGRNRTKEVLEQMNQWLRDKPDLKTLQKQITSQQSSLSHLESQIRMGILSVSDQNLQRNLITHEVLYILDDLEEEISRFRK